MLRNYKLEYLTSLTTNIRHGWSGFLATYTTGVNVIKHFFYSLSLMLGKCEQEYLTSLTTNIRHGWRGLPATEILVRVLDKPTIVKSPAEGF